MDKVDKTDKMDLTFCKLSAYICIIYADISIFMGTFGKSFEREIGKNTGKWVSNVVFGDGHSTPYRRVGGSQEPRKTKAEMLHEQRLEQIEAEERLKRQQIKADDKRKEKEQLLSIDHAVLQNIDAVAGIKIPNNKENLINLLSELATQVKANKWHKNDSEGKIRNKFCDALFEKYKQCVYLLESIDSTTPQLGYHKSIIKKIKRQRFFKKHKWLIIILSIPCLYLLMMTILFLNYIGLLTLTLILGFTIAGFYAIRKLILAFKDPSSSKTIQVPKQAPEKQIVPLPTEQVKEVNESIFFDLNENGRIEQKLSSIWAKYERTVDRVIINRNPIFSADGVKNSILFVGVNPSYNLSDDIYFISGSDNKSLMYGSFYNRSDAPEYFKKLEAFSNQLHKPYTHINLLYARENDRDKLLSFDHNFIREQLELTYDTILKIEPVAIIFFTDYCHDLIFGADRWVNPNNKRNGAYLLNGTNIPVFFTDDITTLTYNKQQELINAIQDTF